MNTAVAIADRSLLALAREVLGLFKLRIGVLITVTALVGFVATPGHAANGWQVLVLALSTLVAAAAAGAFNQYYERDSDRLMLRTRGRAFANGTFAPGPGWLLLMAALLATATASAWWLVNPLAAAFVFLGAFFYGVVYTVWLKRRSWSNIVIGGLSGSFAVLAGAAASDPALGPLPWSLALVLFLWTPPHFWSLAIAGQADYAAAGIPMLPVVVGAPRAARIVHWSTLALVASSLLPCVFGAGWIYFVGAALGGALFLYRSYRLAHHPTRQTAIACFLASLVQLCLVLGGICLDVALG
ncbi:MAG: protoheme IX farnesyltransferase [Rhodanobacteraceae bacterium]|nr:protoheme IX farnesyltransferase [Rhodanobacteraceae bacterium]